jgi:putative peptidoglycan lipid II flippase
VSPERANQEGANKERANLARSAGVASAAIFLSRITGLVRESVMSSLFGAGSSPVMDAFNLGFRIPNLTRDLFAEGALSSAFVPTFTKYLTTKGQGEAHHLYNLVATTLMLIVGTICLLGILFSPLLVEAMASSFHQIPGKFELTVKLTRIMFPFLILVALAAQAMGVLNACNLFGIPALSSVCFNVGSVAFGVLLGRLFFGLEPILGMAWGVVIGGLLQLVSQVPSLVREGFRYAPAFDFSHPGLRTILKLMGPAILGNASVQINVFVNTNFATSLTDAAGHAMNGPVTWLSYAFRFMQLPLGLFGVAIASATLPSISRSAAAGNLQEFRHTIRNALSLVMLLTIPSAVGLVVLGRSMIGAVYQHGKFQASDTEQTALALSCYAVGLTGYSAVKILAPAFYALNDARTPMNVSLFSILVNFVTAYSLIHFLHFGPAGLALSTSIVALINFTILLLLLRARIGGVEGAALALNFVKIAASAAVMAGVCWLVSSAVHHWLPAGFGTRILDLAISIPAGGAAFYGVCSLLRVPELQDAGQAIAMPLLRRLGIKKKPHVKLAE